MSIKNQLKEQDGINQKIKEDQEALQLAEMLEKVKSSKSKNKATKTVNKA